jgi:hypothetical protein
MEGPDQILTPGTLEGDKQMITVLLAQFEACRTEIQTRSGTQATLFNLNLTAAGVVAGYYVSQPHTNPLVLLIIPLLSPMLGIIWADHAINIGNIGRFIQNELTPRLGKLLRSDLPDYQNWISAFESRRATRALLLVSPMLLIFAILPACALAFASAEIAHRDAVFYILGGLGAVSILIFGGYAVAILMGWVWLFDPGAARVGARGGS